MPEPSWPGRRSPAWRTISQHPLHRERVGLANTLSPLRAGAPPALLLVSPAAAGALLLAAGATDAIDGPLARHRNEVTRLGIWLDGAVDSLVLGSAAPWRIVVLVVARYRLPWPAVAAAYFARAQSPGREHAVSGCFRGILLSAGLVLALLGLPDGWLVAAGALGGLATFAVTAAHEYAVPASPS